MQSYILLGAVVFIASVAEGLSGRATSSRHYNGTIGACGCGDENGAYPWQLGFDDGSGHTIYAASVSSKVYGDDGDCGAGCGNCFLLTSSGGPACNDGTCGAGGAAGQSITVMVVDECDGDNNAQWCTDDSGINAYGFVYHFDIIAQSQVLGDNPRVRFSQVDCPAAAVAEYQTCACSG